ncbi:uncharacterized protein LOC118193737, partial [Stegodyphus dumicola]|uniref:uncharacterized protein LOC118193737 n=1 Tax=Stegodyphus dumicola TaxID=202533 RepID=UPI0015A8AB0E
MSYTRSSIVSRNWWDDFEIPSRLRDQHFGLGLSDLDLDASPSFYRGYFLRPRRQLSSGGTSEVKADPEKFQVKIFYLCLKKYYLVLAQKKNDIQKTPLGNSKLNKKIIIAIKR